MSPFPSLAYRTFTTEAKVARLGHGIRDKTLRVPGNTTTLRLSSTWSPPRPLNDKNNRWKNGQTKQASVGWWGVVGVFAAGYGLYQLCPPLRDYENAVKKSLDWNNLWPRQPEYTSLGPGEIRLLILSPGQGDDQVVCRLEAAPLHGGEGEGGEGPTFEALSYVWGRQQPTAQITCGGKMVLVRPNLLEALRSLRQTDRDRVLWVDALCINQTDGEEKSRQIPLMTDIYAKANKVVIWLGEPTEATRNALPALREVNAYLKKTMWFYNDSYVSIFARGFFFFKLGLSRTLSQRQVAELAAFDWASIVALFRHDWFKRAWVYQEFAKARDATVVMGQDEIPLGSLLSPHAEIHLQRIDNEVLTRHEGPDDWQSRASVRDMWLTTPGRRNLGLRPRTLAEVMFENRTRDATDDRDRLFAMLVAAEDLDESDLEVLRPDYTVPTDEVYARFARWSLLQKNHLEFLQYATPNTKSSLSERSLPSWVPDWRTIKFSTPILRDLQRPYDPFPDSKPWVCWQPDQPDILEIRGCVVDRLDRVAVTMAHMSEFDEMDMWLNMEGGLEPSLRWAEKRERENPQDTGARSFREVHQAFIARSEGRDHPLVERWKEARVAIVKYGTKDSRVAWMRDCGQVAAVENRSQAAEQFDKFWRAMTLGRPEVFSSYTLASYMQLLNEGRHPPTAGGEEELRLSTKKKTKEEAKKAELRRKVEGGLGRFLQHRFCRTSGGMLGWVPIIARPGDLICIFDGGPVPFVLRPRSRTEERSALVKDASKGEGAGELPVGPLYELIGEAYVDGMMYGEAVRGKRVGSEVFRLM